MPAEPQFGPGLVTEGEIRETLDAWIQACGDVAVEIDPDYPIPFYAPLPDGSALISLPPNYSLEQFLHEAAHHCDRAGLASILKGVARGRVRVERLARNEQAREEGRAAVRVARWRGAPPPAPNTGPPRIPKFRSQAEHLAWINDCIERGRRIAGREE